MATTEKRPDKTTQPVDRRDQYDESVLHAAQYLVERALQLKVWAPYLNWGDRLEAEGHIKSPAIVKAFKEIPRYVFLTEEMNAFNGIDQPIDIGHGQTNSQPQTVGMMLEWLKPGEGQSVLDIGSGSAWTTALLAHIAGDKGKVIGVERVPELVVFGQNNLARFGFGTAEVRLASEGQLGLPEEAPFDRILVSAHLPSDWLQEVQQQLSPAGGILVAPIIPDEYYGKSGLHCEMQRIVRQGDEFSTEVLSPGFGFVPLIHEADERFVVQRVN